MLPAQYKNINHTKASRPKAIVKTQTKRTATANNRAAAVDPYRDCGDVGAEKERNGGSSEARHVALGKGRFWRQAVQAVHCMCNLETRHGKLGGCAKLVELAATSTPIANMTGLYLGKAKTTANAMRACCTMSVIARQQEAHISGSALKGNACHVMSPLFTAASNAASCWSLGQ